jgi:hypothetical protein
VTRGFRLLTRCRGPSLWHSAAPIRNPPAARARPVRFPLTLPHNRARVFPQAAEEEATGDIKYTPGSSSRGTEGQEVSPPEEDKDAKAAEQQAAEAAAKGQKFEAPPQHPEAAKEKDHMKQDTAGPKRHSPPLFKSQARYRRSGLCRRLACHVGCSWGDMRCQPSSCQGPELGGGFGVASAALTPHRTPMRCCSGAKDSAELTLPLGRAMFSAPGPPAPARSRRRPRHSRRGSTRAKASRRPWSPKWMRPLR